MNSDRIESLPAQLWFEHPTLRSGFNKTTNLFDDSYLLGLSQIRKHRQGHNCAGRAFGDWKITLGVVQHAIGFLQVQRNRIVNAGADALVFQICHQPFAIIDTHHVKVVDRAGPGRLVGAFQPDCRPT